ncbi:MAG: trimethylamine methyltransferase family protein [Spirochaetaceae bacterium]|nr:MAG: trimethylamine methyltransferase family protein [Spirochaetaceae bacterium]
MKELLHQPIETPDGTPLFTGPEFPLSREGIAAIHAASLKVLADTGVRFASESALEIFKKHRFRIEGQRVYFSDRQIQNALESIPKSFTILARNPKHNILIKPGVTSFGMGRGAVNMIQADGSIRRGTKEDLIASSKLCQTMEELEHWGPLIYPTDVDSENVHLWAWQTMLKYVDKPYLYINRHQIELVALAYGTSREEMTRRSDFTRSYGQTTAIIQSPLSMYHEDCEDLIEYARCGIAFHTASMPVAGTTGPCTLSGLVVQQNCENLAPMVLSQLVRPGCPVFYGAIGGRADMKSLTPRFGSAEARIIERAGVQMAHSYGLACRGGAGITDAPSCDFQAGAQAMLHVLSDLQKGPEFLPACGLLGSYVGASLAKVVLDAELIAQARRFLTPMNPTPERLAVEVINEVGPGGYYIEHPHTLEHFRSEFFVDSIFQSLTYEQWSAAGKKKAVHLAHEKAQTLIDSYERPPMDPGLEAEIEAYVERHWIHG